MNTLNRNQKKLNIRTDYSMPSNDIDSMVLQRLLYNQNKSIYETIYYLLKYDNVILMKMILKYCYDHNIDILHERILRIACKNGNLDVVELLAQLGEEQGKEIDIHVYNEQAFRLACYYGHLDIVEYLVQLGEEQGKDINSHAFHEEAFRLVCSNGHLDIAEYLVQLGKEQGKEIDIHANNEYAFQLACYNSHLDLVELLVQLCPEMYSYEILDGGRIKPIFSH